MTEPPIPLADHPLGPLVRSLAAAVRSAGGRAFLVGGAVRDHLLGLPAEDADLEVYGLTPAALEELAGRFGRVHLVGRRFAVLHLAAPQGQVELSLPRTESKTGPGHKGFAVAADPDLPPREACRRRDFTVNAMLLDPLDGELLDFWGGRADLERGLLRHVSPAFTEDPLRALRAARFVARFGWRVAPETIALCRSLDLSELPVERIELEWRQILLRGRRPGAGLLALEDVGALRFFPELAALRGVPQDPVWHPEGDVLRHTALCLDAAARIRPWMEDPWVEMLGVLCHDLGKAVTTRFERGRWRSPNHDAGAEPAVRALLGRLSRRPSLFDRVWPLVREHLRPTQLYHARERVSDGAIRRLATRVDLPALVRVAWSDGAGRGEADFPGRPEDWVPGRWLLERASALGVEEDRPRPLLRGRDLIELGLEPGPEIGRWIARAFELQLDGEITDREEALAWARRRLAGRG
ncbi:MAG: polynucleotide adenylyltransferase [Planctomycetota bacterium]|nr:MAG: polynucleotide adenylyltransferase [Planctomycetota bacterium]